MNYRDYCALLSCLGMLLCVFLGSCWYSKNELRNKVGLDEKSIVLLDSEYNLWLDSAFGYQTWVPVYHDLLIVDSLMGLAVVNGEFDFIKPPVKKNILEYFYRQYVPYINEKGERIVHINALCDISDTQELQLDWENEYIDVEDGGVCYWQMLINMDSLRYQHFGANASR